MATPALALVTCPNCQATGNRLWATERGFNLVRCDVCDLLYVNPRPTSEFIHEAVKTGAHNEEVASLVVRSRRTPRRIRHYERILGSLFSDVWDAGRPISWLDVGAGYGEVVEAVSRLAPLGSSVTGLEPMEPKASAARARGLAVEESYLTSDHFKVDILSTVNVFSHIPDFNEFLALVRSVLKPGGEVFIETGNAADLKDRKEFPGTLCLPDHLVFAGESQITQYLHRAGFDIVKIDRHRVDSFIDFAKNLIKKAMLRPVHVRLPYTSTYRSLLIRAKLRNQSA